MGGIVGIVGFSIRNWRVTLGLMFFAVIAGFLAISRLPLDAEPDVPVPFVNVRVILPGISPEDAERLLIRPLETELKSIDGIKEINSVAGNSGAFVTLEFDISHDQKQALSDVLQKVDRARAEFPREAREPIVEEISIAALPIVTINLWGDVPERELQRRAKDMQSRLESLPEILEAKISGERIDVLEAILDPAKVESLGITYDEIAAAIGRNNNLVPAGALQTDSGKFNVKLPGLIENPEDLGDLVIRRGANNSIIRMSDISVVRSGYKDIENISRFNQRASVSLEVSKRQGENILDSEKRAKDTIEDIISRPDWPTNINVTYSQSRATSINEMMGDLSASIINAVILVFIVCIAALGWRSALFVGWAIPASFLIAFFLFFLQGETINMMILFGLILSVGVLVDSAIVIVEYADRKMDEGLGRKESFQLAAERMFWPIVSSTFTTLVAFIPFLFWETIPGKFMAYFPRTMVYVLSASMFMALIFLPTLGAKIGFTPKKNSNSNAALLAGAEGDPAKLAGFTGFYVKFIRLLIRFPVLVLIVLAAIGLLIVSVFEANMTGPPPKPVEFYTQTPSDRLFVLARTRGNTTPEQSLEIAKELESRILQIDDVASVYTIAGPGAAGGGSFAFTGPSNVPNDATVRIYTELIPFDERRNGVAKTVTELERVSQGIPGVITEVTAIDMGPPIGKDIGIQISGENREELKQTALSIRKKLESIEGVYDIEDTLPLPGVDWEIDVDRAEAGRLGLDVGRIGAAIQFLTEGALVGQYRPLNVEEEVDIRVRYPKGARDLSQLDSLRIQTPQGALPISSVVKRVPVSRQDQIERRDLSAFYVVRGNTRAEYATQTQVAEIEKWLSEDANIPAGTKIKFLGQAEENAETIQFGKTAAISILFMMSAILLLQFNNFYHVFLTLMAVILSVFGVILGLIFYPYVSMILVLTGVIALAGIVVNNNIVLIDTYQRLMRLGFSSEDAALRTAAQRLRPVILTTLTTVVGLMPLVLGWQANIFSGEFSTQGSSTSDIWAPISYVLCCGLAFATLLTLIVTPVLLAMPSVFGRRIVRLRKRLNLTPINDDNLLADENMGTDLDAAIVDAAQ